MDGEMSIATIRVALVARRIASLPHDFLAPGGHGGRRLKGMVRKSVMRNMVFPPSGVGGKCRDADPRTLPLGGHFRVHPPYAKAGRFQEPQTASTLVNRHRSRPSAFTDGAVTSHH
jgi:hypothetical protein